MISELDPQKAPCRVAAEEAVIVGAFAFLSGLIATGMTWPLEASVLYAAGIVAALAGVTAWARKRMIEVKKP
jgi:uncharacterized membrane protein